MTKAKENEGRMGVSSIIMLFIYLAPLQNYSIVTSRCTQFTFSDKREVNLLGESAAVPVNKKERMREGKKNIGSRMKYGLANLN